MKGLLPEMLRAQFGHKPAIHTSGVLNGAREVAGGASAGFDSRPLALPWPTLRAYLIRTLTAGARRAEEQDDMRWGVDWAGT